MSADENMMSTNSPEQCLAEFIKSFGASLDTRTWLTMIREELQEVSEETPGTAEYLKEACDVLYVLTGFSLVCDLGVVGALLPDYEQQEAADMVNQTTKVSATAARFYGDDVLAEAFYRVHKSNMSKLGDDGKPIRRDDGKVMKGPNYKPPVLDDLILGT